MPQRILEAERLGFQRAIFPEGSGLDQTKLTIKKYKESLNKKGGIGQNKETNKAHGLRQIRLAQGKNVRKQQQFYTMISYIARG